MKGKYKAAPNFIHRKIAGTDVLISVGANVADFNGYIELNPTASLLWDYLREERSKEELVSYLLDQFTIEEDTAKEDVSDFINVLKEHNMITEI